MKICLTVVLLLLTACTEVVQQPPTPVLPKDALVTPMTVRATGHGTVRPDAGYTTSQMRLMAQRAARIDAYRILTEHIYGLQLFGATSVSAMLVKNDAVRTYVNGFIRGAREVSTTRVGDDYTYETVLEIVLNDDFLKYCYRYYTQPTSPGYCVDATAPGCSYQDRL